MIIRREQPEEYGIIYDLVETAFSTAKVSNGDEQNYVDNLRQGEGYIPELSLVAETDGKIVGHIMLSKTLVVSDEGRSWEVLILAPLSVLRQYRSRGIGAALVEESFRLASDMGFGSVFLVGDPAYYGRFGFTRTDDHGIVNDHGIPPQFTLCKELIPDALESVKGIIKF